MIQTKDIYIYLFIIGAAQGIQLSIFLWRKKENKLANSILAVEMLVMVLHLLFGVIFLNNMIIYFPQLLGLNNTIPFLYGPLFYLFVKYLVKKINVFRPKDYLHLLPFILFQVYGIFFFYFEDSSYILSLLTPHNSAPWHMTIIGKFIPVSGIVYTYLSIHYTVKFNRAIKECFSNIDKINLQWLVYYVVGVGIIWTVVILRYLVNFIWEKGPQLDVFIFVAMALFLIAVGYRSLTQTEIAKIDDINEESDESTQYKKSGLAEQTAANILDDLLNVMETKKPYLSSDLKLSDLAALIGATNHNLSEVINKKLKQNFYDFVNKYRVEEVKKLISADSAGTYNLLGLGFESGFSSKSAFYSSFKKVTGKTPSEFKTENKT